jgi:hypothetical protein
MHFTFFQIYMREAVIIPKPITKMSFAATRDATDDYFHISAERLSSAMTCVGAEYAARSIIRDNAGHSL